MKRTIFIRSSKSNNLSVGIVGLPNTGKSTLFNFLTKNSVPAENYPFCTIDPSFGKVEIQDPRINNLERIFKPAKTIRAYLGVTDIAGLVKGANEGIGLGNNFLDNIRNVDAIFHVVRCFENPEVLLHVEDCVDPIRDIKIVNDELRLKDLQTLAKHYEKIKKDSKSKPLDKKMKDILALLERVLGILESSWVNEHEFTEEEIVYISTLNLLTTKNIVYLANISEEDYEKKRVNKHLRSLINFSKNIIVFSAVYESSGDKSSSFLDKVVKNGYDMLDLINFFTCGPDEVRSWTIRKGTLSPDAGGVIHSDFKNYFITSEVLPYEGLFDENGADKKQHKYCQRGKTYVVNDGDIMIFKHGKAPVKKKK